MVDIIQVLQQPTSIVQTVTQGPQGPPGEDGPEGPQGPPGGNYRHVQNAPATTWVITHNLGFRPSVTVVDTSGQVIEGDITYVSENVVNFTVNNAFAGEAYLS